MDFLEIYDLHHRPVKTFISKMVGDKWLADDLTQDTFIKVRKNLNGLKDDSKIMPWIFRIARNRCLDYFRSGAARNKGQELTNRFQKSIEPVVQMQLEQRQMSQCVQDKIYLLPETLRVALCPVFMSIILVKKVRKLLQSEYRSLFTGGETAGQLKTS
jgi:RNA polymerase sigma-70 factor (ECF subfamily)